MISLEDIQKLRSDLGTNKLDRVFAGLAVLEKGPRGDDIRLLKRRYTAAISNNQQEFITPAEARVQLNNISAALLKLLNELEVEIQQKNTASHGKNFPAEKINSSKKIAKYRWPILAAIVALIGVIFYSNFYWLSISGSLENPPAGISLDTYVVACQSWETKADASGAFILEVPFYIKPEENSSSYELLIYSTERPSDRISQPIRQLNSNYKSINLSAHGSSDAH